MFTPQKLADWLSRLVQIPTVNPTQAGPAAGTPGEAALAEEVVRWFEAFGGQVQTHEIYPGRYNVYGIWRGREERWAALDIHMDTVGVEQMTGEPFSGHITNGCVYGRGAVDTKASLAVALALLEDLHQYGHTPALNLLIAATVDEENSARTAPDFAAWVLAQQIPLSELMVAEPTNCRPVYGHKGGLRMRFTVSGQASHSSQPQQGKNAITAAARLITALEQEHQKLENITSDIGTPTLTVSRVDGGIGANVVPDRCTIVIDRRIVTGENVDHVAKNLTELAIESCPLPVDSQILGALAPFFQSPDAEWLQKLADWSGQQPGIVPYGTNAWAYGNLPGECVVLGPGSIDQAHSAIEWVAISQLEKLAAIYQKWWGAV
jgi:acetylornithine deacetylase/succinyl-diaminopimelate desuccinylase-like protein